MLERTKMVRRSNGISKTMLAVIWCIVFLLASIACILITVFTATDMEVPAALFAVTSAVCAGASIAWAR